MEIWVKSQILWNYCVTTHFCVFLHFTVYSTNLSKSSVYIAMNLQYDTSNNTAANQGNISSWLSDQLSLYIFSVQVFSLAQTADSNFWSLKPTVTPTSDVI